MKGAALYIRNPLTKEETYLATVEREASIGKSQTADIQIEDLRCNGLHAIVEKQDSGKFRVLDLGSHFGTYSGGKKIVEKELEAGDVFSIGHHHLVLRDLQEGFPYIQVADQTGQERDEDETEKSLLFAEHSVLQTSLYWGEQLLDVRTFKPGADITLGSDDREATFSLTLAGIQDPQNLYKIASYQKGLLYLYIPEEATGMIWTGSEALSLDAIRHKDESSKAFGDIQITLRVGDRADIQIGELTLSFRFVSPAAKPPFQMPQVNKTFSAIISALILFYSILFLWLTFGEAKVETKSLKDIPKHLKKVIFDAGIENALKRQQAAIGQILKTLEGGRARSEEGEARAKKAPKKETKSKQKNKKTQKKPSKRKLKTTRTKSKAKKVSDAPTVDLDAAFTSPSKNSQFQVDAVVGKRQSGNTAAALAKGGFARGRSGLGAGGGGKSVGIGQLTGNSTGGGLGAGDYGLSPSKGKEIDIQQADELVILGGLDRDIIAERIRNYLPQIRACYEKELVKSPKLRGKVTSSFIIGGNGSVKSVTIVESSLRNATVEGCIKNVILTWKFPRPLGGKNVGVKYPFLLMSNTGN